MSATVNVPRSQGKHRPGAYAGFMKRTLQVLLVLFGAEVSLVAFMAVLEGWQAFNVKAKCVAVEFLVTLILYPAVVAKTGKPNDAVQYSGLVFGYALVLMALLVFTGH
jgi:hypothetical protein